ncbi:MAG: SPFH domain-containing protein [Planctomycetota bacterium]
MKNPFFLAIAAIIVLGFTLYMTTFTVRFTEAAVKATFGNVDPNSGIIEEEGLHFRLPAPFQRVIIYDTRSRLIEASAEQQRTADNREVILGTYVVWRVVNPLKFYQQFSSSGSSPESQYEEARRQIEPRLRSSLAAVSNFELDELFHSSDAESSIAELEQEITDRLRGVDTGDVVSLDDFGIEVQMIGIDSIELPATTVTAVVQGMKTAAEAEAASIASVGAAEANAIRSEGNNNAETILQFAKTLASALRNQGEVEAAEYYALLEQDPELARFLETMEFMREGLNGRINLILRTTTPGFQFFEQDNLKTLIPAPSRRAEGDDAAVIPAVSAEVSQ